MPETSAVRQLHETPVERVIASGVSIVVSLPEGRQISFTTGFEGDESDADVNARFDRIMRLADRQRARYELAELEEELKRHLLTNERMEKDQAAVESRYEVHRAQRVVEQTTVRRDVESAAVQSGRSNATPRGASKRTLDLIQIEIDKADAEHKVGKENFAETMKRHLEETALCEAKIAKTKALAEG